MDAIAKLVRTIVIHAAANDLAHRPDAAGRIDADNLENSAVDLIFGLGGTPEDGWVNEVLKGVSGYINEGEYRLHG